uniref:Uncharacterized protein n=1 Tax=Arundo donax TaxID=35708 RepID=A0A0A9DKL5_ARUDO
MKCDPGPTIQCQSFRCKSSIPSAIESSLKNYQLVFQIQKQISSSRALSVSEARP